MQGESHICITVKQCCVTVICDLNVSVAALCLSLCLSVCVSMCLSVCLSICIVNLTMDYHTLDLIQFNSS